MPGDVPADGEGEHAVERASTPPGPLSPPSALVEDVAIFGLRAAVWRLVFPLGFNPFLVTIAPDRLAANFIRAFGLVFHNSRNR